MYGNNGNDNGNYNNNFYNGYNNFNNNSNYPSINPEYKQKNQQNDDSDFINSIMYESLVIGEIVKEKVNPALKKYGLKNHEAEVCLVLDCSWSMQNPNEFFWGKDKVLGNSKVEKTIQQVLAIASKFDDNMNIELIPFGAFESDSKKPPVLSISLKNYKKNYPKGVTKHVLKNIKTLQGETNYAEAFKAVHDYYYPDGLRPDKIAKFVVFITDGDCTSDTKKTLDLIKQSSKAPIFYKFIGLAGSNNPKFELLKKIDDMKERKLDNADFFEVSDPDKISMDDFFNEYPGFLKEAYNKKILTKDPKLDKSIEVDDDERIVDNKQIKKKKKFFKIF